MLSGQTTQLAPFGALKQENARLPQRRTSNLWSNLICQGGNRKSITVKRKLLEIILLILFIIVIIASTPYIGNRSFEESDLVDLSPNILPAPQPAQPVLDGCAQFIEHMKHPKDLSVISKLNVFHQSKTQDIPLQIHFLHYNPTLEINKYLCSVESAAIQNIFHTIIIHVVDTVTFEAAIKNWRSTIDTIVSTRIVIRKLDWLSMMTNTPLEPWFREERYKKSKWVNQNLGNAWRLGLIWKYGGVYLDMDIVSVNPLAEIGRSLAKQDSKRLNNAYFSFSKEDKFIWAVMQEFVDAFNGYRWGWNGPEMITRAYNKTCGSTELSVVCDGLNVAPTSSFFPIKYGERAWLFEDWTNHCDLLRTISETAVGLHWWNKRTPKTVISNETLTAVVLKNACPGIFRAFSDQQLGIGVNGLLGAKAYKEVEKGMRF